jgi:hypothetical protein
MVGLVTLLMAIQGLPATKESLPVVVTVSGPATGWGLGGVLGQMGIWVWPGDGCQTGVWALREIDTETRRTAKIKDFITTPPDMRSLTSRV